MLVFGLGHPELYVCLCVCVRIKVYGHRIQHFFSLLFINIFELLLKRHPIGKPKHTKQSNESVIQID